MGHAWGLVVKPKALETRKDHDMRRYCRNVDISNIDFIKRCIYLWLDGKKNRRDVLRFFAAYSDLPARQIREAAACENYSFVGPAVERIAQDVQHRIKAHALALPPIRFRDKYDPCSGKWRKIGIQEPIHQVFDYIAVEGCMDMFRAKIGPYQMASIPGRGQEKGAKTILRWLQLDGKHTRYYLQADIRQCYPSIAHGRIKALFTRDIKNPELLWLVHSLIDSFPEGLSIGSYFSQYACNYYLSYAYHYAAEQLFKVRKKKKAPEERVRLAYHILFYMDDILLLGSSKKDLETGIHMLGEYIMDKLGLELKPGWGMWETDYIGKDGKHYGRFIDMMGYRIYCDHITIRRSTFKKIRRSIIRAEARIAEGNKIPLDLARIVMSRTGRIFNSNSFGFSKKYNLEKVKNKAGKIISCHDKTEAEEKKKRRILYDCQYSTLPGEAGSNAVSSVGKRESRSVAPEEHPTDYSRS